MKGRKGPNRENKGQIRRKALTENIKARLEERPSQRK